MFSERPRLTVLQQRAKSQKKERARQRRQQERKRQARLLAMARLCDESDGIADESSEREWSEEEEVGAVLAGV